MLWRDALARPVCFCAYMAESAVLMASVASAVSCGMTTVPNAVEVTVVFAAGHCDDGLTVEAHDVRAGQVDGHFLSFAATHSFRLFDRAPN